MGDINYAKAWCGFSDFSKTNVQYKAWREQLKSYISTLNWKPAELSHEQWESLFVFAGCLAPIKERRLLIETQHRPDDVDELERLMKILVRDVAKKLHTSKLNSQTQHGGTGHRARSTSKSSA